MKKQIALIAVCGLLCFSSIGVLTSCSNDKNTLESTNITSTKTTEAMLQSISVTSDNAKLQSRTVIKDDVLWLVQSGSSAEFNISGRNASLTLAGSSGIKSDEAHRPRYAVYIDDKLICDV